MNLSKSLLALPALFLLAGDASAQTLPWTTTYPPTSFSSRERVFTGTDGTVSYVYGGQNGTTTAGYDELWSYDGADYQLLSASGTGPGPRCGGASAHDLARGKFVIFGGKLDWAAGTLLSDTWEWDSVNGWVQLTPATSPSGRWLIGDTCEYVPGFGLVFHGGNVGGTKSSETWAFDGTNWTLLSSAGPDRNAASMVYRPTSNDMILYGGVGNASGAKLAETWRFDLGTLTWSQITTTTMPHGNGSTSDGLVAQTGYFNPTTSKVVLYGGDGNGGSNPSHLTWEFDGVDWTDATDPAQLSSENVRNSMANWVASSQSAIILCGNRSNSAQRFVLEHGPFAGPPPVFYCGYTDPSTATSCGFMSCPSSSGCQATIATSIPGGGPVSGANDYDVSFNGAEVGKPAIIFFGLSGTMAVPFSSGTLCVQTPIKRTPPGSTGGSGACTGSHSLRINDPASSINQTAGTMVHYQGWLRDPAGVGTDLSDAVELLFQ